MYGNSTPACNAHLAGPQVTKFCGVGGVFYTYMLSQGDEDQGVWSPTGEDSTPTDSSTASYPGQIKPYGLDSFTSDALLNLTASVGLRHSMYLPDDKTDELRVRPKDPPEHTTLPERSTLQQRKVKR